MAAGMTALALPVGREEMVDRIVEQVCGRLGEQSGGLMCADALRALSPDERDILVHLEAEWITTRFGAP